MRRLALVFIALCSVFTSHAQIEITKTKRAENPTIYLASWQGPNDLRTQLIEDLRLSDWFDIATSPEADYHLTAKATFTEADRYLELKLTTGAGEKVVHFRQPGADDRRDWLVHQGVDSLIQQVFKRPGFCTSMMAYVLQKGDVKEIWIADFNGANPRQITYNKRLSVEPTWRADNNYLLYTSYGVYSTSIVLVDLKAQTQQRISTSRGLNSSAAFSPDGLSIALSLSQDDNVELYTMRLRDFSKKRLTHSIGVETSPTWSPDGSQICFVSDSSRLRPGLQLIPSGGGGVQRLVSSVAEAVSPDWSPVSNQVVYSMRHGPQYVIAVLDMNKPNEEPKIVTRSAGDWESPAWAADGRHVICSRDLGGRKTLMVVDTWYRKAQQIGISGGEPSLPAYSNRF